MGAGAFELVGRRRWNADQDQRNGGWNPAVHIGDKAAALGLEIRPIAKMKLGMKPISLDVFEGRVDRPRLVVSRESLAELLRSFQGRAASLPCRRRVGVDGKRLVEV